MFLADSGSVSVEVAIKMCLQYWRSLGRPEKRRLFTWRGGYHGDTWQPMSVCDPEGGMHGLWAGVLPRQVFAPPPPEAYEESYAALLRELIGQHAGELAAVVVEPVVQGAGGMRFHSPAYLRVLREACDAHDVLLVFDEIATGFGRTGALFAAERAAVTPDVMCVGKALTGGYLTLAATLCTARVADGISRGEVPVLAHGPTFMGNPLAAAVACASVELLLGQDWRTEVKRVETGLQEGLAAARTSRGCGRSGSWVPSVSSSSTARWTWRRRPGPPCARACGCGRSATSSTPCRRTSRTTRTWHGSAARCARPRGRDDMPILVITGTGTEVGKTVTTAAVAASAVAAGRTVAVLKAAQTGVRPDERGDADEVARLAGRVTARELARYPEPLAPGTAARRAGRAPVHPQEIAEAAAKLATEHDLVLVEGAGGLLVRFDPAGGTLADAAGLLAAPVLVVAAAGLGTLNTTELTAREVRRRGAGTGRCRDRQLAHRAGPRLALQSGGPAGGGRSAAAGGAVPAGAGGTGAGVLPRGGSPLAGAAARRDVGRGGVPGAGEAGAGALNGGGALRPVGVPVAGGVGCRCPSRAGAWTGGLRRCPGVCRCPGRDGARDMTVPGT
ncbi:hypothetical protein GCM10020295_11450 [Streptomyces cinereospinus]